MNQKKVFITRDLNPRDYFFQALSSQGFEVSGESLIDFSPIFFDDLPKADWIFFYSKNAVTFFHQIIKIKHLELSKETKLAAFGKGTAKRVEAIFKRVDYIGTGKAESSASQFADISEGQSVLFPRARNSRKSVQQLIADKVRIQDLIIYENNLRQSATCSSAKILVFTSPMNVQNYLKHCPLHPYQTFIAIGEPTKKTLVTFGINSVITPEEPTEKALVDLILSLNPEQN